jgi:hypothetical protein
MAARADDMVESVESVVEVQVVSATSGEPRGWLSEKTCRREETGEGTGARRVARWGEAGGDEAGSPRAGRGSGGGRAGREDAEVGGGGGHDSIDRKGRDGARGGRWLHGGYPGWETKESWSNDGGPRRWREGEEREDLRLGGERSGGGTATRR